MDLIDPNSFNMKLLRVLTSILLIMGCDRTYQVDISKKYYVLGEGLQKRLLFNHVNKIGIVNEIYSNVSDYVFDESFLVLEQKPVEDFYGDDLSRAISGQYIRDARLYTSSGLLPREYEIWPGYTNYENFQIFSVIDVDSSISNNQNYQALNYISDSLQRFDPYQNRIISSKVNYWILNLKTDKLHGPLRFNDYLIVKDSLGVNPVLKLKAENEIVSRN